MATLTLTAVLHKEDDLYVAECPEVGTVSQGYTVEEAIVNLKEATELYLEEFPLPQVSKPFLTTFEAAVSGAVSEATYCFADVPAAVWKQEWVVHCQPVGNGWPPSANSWAALPPTTCQFPLPGDELASICPTYARFPARPFCLEFQIRVQYVAPGLVHTDYVAASRHMNPF